MLLLLTLYRCTRATGSIKSESLYRIASTTSSNLLLVNITQIQDLGNEWNSDVLKNAYANLSKNTTNANVGSFTGNKMFYANDYMVRARYTMFVCVEILIVLTFRFNVVLDMSPLSECIPTEQRTLNALTTKM